MMLGYWSLPALGGAGSAASQLGVAGPAPKCGGSSKERSRGWFPLGLVAVQDAVMASGDGCKYNPTMALPLPTAQRIAARCYAMRVRRLNRSLTRLYGRYLDPHGLSAARFNLLVAIAANPGVTASQLVGPLEIDKSTLSRNLRGMRADGIIVSSPNDGRERALQATDDGIALLERALPDWERAQTEVDQRLGDLVEALAQT
ncbi:MAG: MarR family winged helix-turn-helix transcriptional regulator [Myxococcota bacterium]